MPKVQIYWDSKKDQISKPIVESFFVNNDTQAINLVRRRNTDNIVKATYKGEIIYSTPIETI